MDKNEIIKILEDWNFWKRDLDTGLERPYLFLDEIQEVKDWERWGGEKRQILLNYFEDILNKEENSQ